LNGGRSTPLDRLDWRWSRGAATSKPEFGDPSTTTNYVLCVYDETAGSPHLLMRTVIPAGAACASSSCWKSTAKGFKYRDKNGSHSGISKVTLKEGKSGASQVILLGRGANLGLPQLPFDQDTTVTAQLRNDFATVGNPDGGCWGAAYDAPAIRNDDGQFRDSFVP
jgi:hypothetical protein